MKSERDRYKRNHEKMTEREKTKSESQNILQRLQHPPPVPPFEPTPAPIGYEIGKGS